MGCKYIVKRSDCTNKRIKLFKHSNQKTFITKKDYENLSQIGVELIWHDESESDASKTWELRLKSQKSIESKEDSTKFQDLKKKVLENLVKVRITFDIK